MPLLTEQKTEEKLSLEKDPLPALGKEKLPTYKPARYTIVATSMQSGVEANYYWTLDFLQKKGDYGLDCKVEKIKDLFTAGITSAFWGSVEQRKAIQQEKATTFLATIGKMVKDTFQIVRELRIIDERLDYYRKSNPAYYKKNHPEIYEKEKLADLAPDEILSAEIALKGVWIDMVEGGAKNPASVYGLATQVGFVVLPDLFFRLSPKTTADIPRVVRQAEALGINKKVIEVLSRKLFQYLTWKAKTHNEISTRRRFVLKYLRQHYNVIKLYMNWLRPYLKNIRELQMQGLEGPELAKAFETSRIELELVGYKESYTTTTPEGYVEEHKFKKHFPAIRVKFNFTSMPHMAYQTEQQRGAIHLGKSEIIFEAYVVTKEDIEKYRKKKDQEDFELVSSLTEAMEALGKEFLDYLAEAKEILPEKEEKKPEEKKPATFRETFEPFTAVISGITEAARSLVGLEKKPSKEEKPGEIKISPAAAKKEQKAAAKIATTLTFVIYDVYKKAHGLMTPA